MNALSTLVFFQKKCYNKEVIEKVSRKGKSSQIKRFVFPLQRQDKNGKNSA